MNVEDRIRSTCALYSRVTMASGGGSLPGHAQRSIQSLWPFNYKPRVDIYLNTTSHYKFVREETLKTTAILAGDGIELSRLMKLHPLGESDFCDASHPDAVRKATEPGQLGDFCRFMVDHGAWLTFDCWTDLCINIGPDPDYWMLYVYLAEKPGTLLEQYHRLKYLSNSACVMRQWQFIDKDFKAGLDAAWLARARASQWVGADPTIEELRSPDHTSPAGILLVNIRETTRKTFPLYAKACEEALFDVHDGEKILLTFDPDEDDDSFESTQKRIMDTEDLELASNLGLLRLEGGDLHGDHPLTRAWRLRLRMAALRAKRLHEMASIFLAFVAWYPQIMAWAMRARERANAPGGAGAKRSRERFEATAACYFNMNTA
tara:strand:+ start:5011 stop:6138 length:1128 start_codon:yes stop_codon:yes gene_type:complete